MPRRIVYVQYSNPAAYPPLMHSARILADAGWHVLVLGIKDAATANLEFPTHPRITQKRLPRVALGWRRALYFLYFCVWVIWHALRWRAEWVYAADLFATPGALALSLVPKVRVVYHENDAPQGVGGMGKWCLTARRRLSQRAAVCVLSNSWRAENFLHEVGGSVKTQVVMNCPERREVRRVDAHMDETFRILYHGSIVPARLPLTVIDALAKLPPQTCLRVVGYETVGHAGYVKALLQRARELGIDERVEWLGQVPTREHLLVLARECNVGLALMPLHSNDENERTMAGASNKPFDYMACGLALAVSDLSDWNRMFVANGFAHACNPDDADSIARAVSTYLEHRDERRAESIRAQDKILEDWNYETQFAPVQELLEGAEPR